MTDRYTHYLYISFLSSATDPCFNVVKLMLMGFHFLRGYELDIQSEKGKYVYRW